MANPMWLSLKKIVKHCCLKRLRRQSSISEIHGHNTLWEREVKFMIVQNVSFWWTRSGFWSAASLFQSSLVDVSCEIYVVLFALRPLLPARAKAERSNKGKREEAAMKVITGLWLYWLQSLVSKPSLSLQILLLFALQSGFYHKGKMVICLLLECECTSAHLPTFLKFIYSLFIGLLPSLQWPYGVRSLISLTWLSLFNFHKSN